MKFSITHFFSKCDQIHRFLRIWSHLLKKSVMENFIFCAVIGNTGNSKVMTARKMRFSIKDFFSKCDQISRKLQICSHLLKKSLMENFIFCAVVMTELLFQQKKLRFVISGKSNGKKYNEFNVRDIRE